MVGMGTFLKIATLNLCLGLKFKKDLVKNILVENDIDILSMQETEIESNFDCELLKIPGYALEYEKNDFKRRVGIYIRENIRYERLDNVEGLNTHMIVIDVLNG